MCAVFCSLLFVVVVVCCLFLVVITSAIASYCSWFGCGLLLVVCFGVLVVVVCESFLLFLVDCRLMRVGF